MTAAIDPVQVQHARIHDTEGREAVVNHILRLLGEGITNRSDIACRVWQTVPGSTLCGDLSSLMDEAFSRWRGGASTPAAPVTAPAQEFSTSDVGNPGYPDMQDPQEIQRQSSKENEAAAAAVRAPETTEKKDEEEEDARREGAPATVQKETRHACSWGAWPPPIDHPLRDYLYWAVGRNQDEKKYRGGRASPLFHFIRWAKAHPDLAGLTVQQAFQRVEQAICSWRATPRGANPWYVWLKVGRDTAEAEFYGAWDAIRYLPFENPLTGALDRAFAQPLTLLPKIAERRPEGYALFVGLSGWLQVMMGDRNILLPVAEVADLLNVDRSTVSRYRRWAKEDGYLKEVKQAIHRSKGKGEASEFRFDVTRFDALQEHAQRGTGEAFAAANPQA
jgi:hypothetical protein